STAQPELLTDPFQTIRRSAVPGERLGEPRLIERRIVFTESAKQQRPTATHRIQDPWSAFVAPEPFGRGEVPFGEREPPTKQRVIAANRLQVTPEQLVLGD